MLHFGQLDQSPEDNPQKHLSRDNKSALGNFTTFTGKHLCQSLFFGLQFIKKETLAQVFSCECCEIFKNTFLYRTKQVARSVSFMEFS